MTFVSGGYTVSDVITEMEYLFGKSDDTDTTFQDLVLSAINDVENELWTDPLCDWSFTHTTDYPATTAGVTTIALPSDIESPTAIENMFITAEGVRIRPLTQRKADSANLKNDTSGVPVRYGVWDDQTLQLRPIPDAAYTITRRYKRLPSALTGTSSNLNTPAKYQHVVKAGVFRELCKTIDDDRWTTADMDFEKKKKKAWSSDSRWLESDLAIAWDPNIEDSNDDSSVLRRVWNSVD